MATDDEGDQVEGAADAADAPIRVAVLGGGVGAITAAFDLTSPRHRGRYDVTVYQLGWRLGGKGASGRGANGRIEEHGLHIWLGFYENAFRLMRECYDELGRGDESPLATMGDAFQPAPRFGVAEQRLDRWQTWTNWFPDQPGRPGDERPGDRSPHTVLSSVKQLVGLGQSVVRGLFDMDGDHIRLRVPDDAGTPSHREPAGAYDLESGATLRVRVPASEPDLSSLLTAMRRRVDQAGAVADGVELAALAAAYELVSMLEAGLDYAGTASRSILSLLDGVVDALGDHIADTMEDQEPGRRILEMVDLAVTVATGLIRDGVIDHRDGFDALDHYDLRDWLYLHGARRSTVEGGLIRGIYDLVFAYRDGAANRPSFAAGQAIRGMLRMFFDYRGAFAYRMAAGMGDTVFGPYYEVLVERGVTFEFFHRVTDIVPSEDGRRIDEVVLERQAEVIGDVYDPLVEVEGLPCWPAEPKWESLTSVPLGANGERPDFESPWNQPPPVGAPIRLRAGHDDGFDHVVFGLSLGSVPHVCSKLLDQSIEWRAMVENVGTVQTQALQIWMSESTNVLGGDPDMPVIAAYVEPFDTWADMSHLIPRERWPADDPAESIHYFCSAMPGPSMAPPAGHDDVQQTQNEIVFHNSHVYLDYHVGQFLPGAVDSYPSEFRWDLLAGADESQVGHDRLHSQYFRANCAPSERYVQTLPGTSKFRLQPGDSGYENLALAGDWTDCGFNAGCVEAATMSGLLAARAVAGDPNTADIIGFDFA